MTIQDILDELKISKGAFYHYFDSKQDLLEALIDQMIEAVLQLVTPILEDPNRPAIEKFHRFLDATARWKTERKEYLLALFRNWYADENALVRQKQIDAIGREVAPLLTQIIRQGIQEGVFSTPFPEEASKMVLSVLQGLGDNIARMILTCDPSCDDLPYMSRLNAACSDGLERILGAPAGSLHLFDDELLKDWTVSSKESLSESGT